MALLSAKDQQELKKEFAALTRPVKLVLDRNEVIFDWLDQTLISTEWLPLRSLPLLVLLTRSTRTRQALPIHFPAKNAPCASKQLPVESITTHITRGPLISKARRNVSTTA